MADKQNATETPVRPSSTSNDEKRTENNKVTGENEQFPGFFLERKVSHHKPKSHSTSEVFEAPVSPDEDRAQAIDRMKSISPPLNLAQARQRRESIKDSAREVRKASISLIRSRTASRVEASARPVLQEIQRLEEV